MGSERLNKSHEIVASYAALLVSVLALVVSGLSYCSDAEEREDQRALVWQSEDLSKEDGLKLTQPNANLSVQSVVVTFPSIARKEPIALGPSERQIRPTWLYGGLIDVYRSCARAGNEVLINDVMPVAVVTHYSLGQKFYTATHLYSLHYMTVVSEFGDVSIHLTGMAMAAPPAGGAPIVELVRSWRPAAAGSACKV